MFGQEQQQQQHGTASPPPTQTSTNLLYTRPMMLTWLGLLGAAGLLITQQLTNVAISYETITSRVSPLTSYYSGVVDDNSGNVDTSSKKGGERQRHNHKHKANRKLISTSVQIGEDCNDVHSSCSYFYPKEFVQKTWYKWMSENQYTRPDYIQYGKLYNIDEDVCNKYDNSLLSLMSMWCLSSGSDDYDDGQEYCRPRSSSSGKSSSGAATVEEENARRAAAAAAASEKLTVSTSIHSPQSNQQEQQPASSSSLPSYMNFLSGHNNNQNHKLHKRKNKNKKSSLALLNVEHQHVEEINPNLPNWMYLPKKFTYKHIRQTGGHSMDYALMSLTEHHATSNTNATSKSSRKVLRDPLFRMFHIQSGREGDVNVMANDFLNMIEKEQREFGSEYHPLFSIVRDPVQRFVSASSQALKDDDTLRNACIKWKASDGASGGQGGEEEEKQQEQQVGNIMDATETLNCILSEVERGYSYTPFVPMVADLYCNVRNHNVRVSLYHMNNLPNVLNALNDDVDSTKKHNDHSNSGLSVQDLNDDLIRRICKLYISDVLMMESLGFDVPDCSFFSSYSGN